MSAYIVNDETISRMLRAASVAPYMQPSYTWQGLRVPFAGNEQEIGQKLLDENYRSVNYRYGEHDEPHQYQHKFLGMSVPMIQAVKSIHCYMYQACETDDWQDTEAYAIARALKSSAVHNLPGYDDAEWG